MDKGDFLMGKELRTEEATVLYVLINMYIKYRIWKYKLAGVLPLAKCISNDLNRWVDSLVSHKMAYDAASCEAAYTCIECFVT